MEDERGAGGHDDGGGSDPPLSSKLAGESFVENMGSDNQAEEAFIEGDGEEIMVEVVGSDVYVDGISGNEEVDCEMGEAGDLEGRVVDKTDESTDVSREGDENKMTEGGLGSSELGEDRVLEKNEESTDVSREGGMHNMVEGGLGSAELSDEKPGVTEKIDINLSKSVGIEDEKVSALLVGGVGGANDEECNPGTKATDVSSSEATVVAGASPMEICEEEISKDETVDKDISEVVMSEPSSHHVEAVSDEKSNLAEEKEVLPSSDNSVSHDHVAADYVKSHGENEETNDGNDDVIGQVHPVNASGGELLDSGTLKDGSLEAEVECPSSDGDSGNRDKSASEKDVCAAESENLVPETDAIVSEVPDASQNCSDEKDVCDAEIKNSIPEPDAPVSEVPDESQNCSVEFHGAKLEVKDQTDGACASHAGTEPIHENSLESQKGETGGNDKSSKTDGDLETHKAQNDVSSGMPIKPSDGGDTAEVNDKCLNFEVKDDVEDDVPNKKSLSCPTDKETIQSDSGIDSDQPVTAETEGAETGDQNVMIPQVEVVDEGGSGEKDGEINSEKLGKSLVGHGNAEILVQGDSAESIHPPEEGDCAEVETADAMLTEDQVLCQDPTSEEVAAEECGSSQSTKQVGPLQITETSNHKAEDTDMVPNEVTNVAADYDINSKEFVVGECGSPQSKKEVVALHITEASNHEAESTNMMPNEVTNFADVPDITQVSIIPEGTRNIESLVSSTDISLLDGGGIKENGEGYKSMEADEMPRESNGFHVLEAHEGHMSEVKLMDVDEEGESDQSYHGGREVDTELASEGPSESDKSKIANEEMLNYAGFLRMKQSGYLTSPKNEGCFAPSDLVWGKVRSHPWWPGQIFDPADASEKAVKYHKKDSYLVAYFGDQTFAWNDSSALKPFRSYFSQIQKQSNSESFHNAVNHALEEVERRVQLGLSCSCIPKDDYAKIENQVVENTGIREESSQRYGVDQSSCASRFEPNELLEFIRAVAPRASSGADGLDLVIARAQLSAFCCFKGYRSPTELPASGELLEIDGDTEHISDGTVASHKHRPKEGAQSRKERSMMELMGDREYSPDAEDEFAGDHEKSVSLFSGKKRKALDPLAEGSDKRVSFAVATSQAPKPSFKIGECIRRVASQLTGSASLVKGSNDEMVVDGSPNIYEPSEKKSMTAESLSVNEMLSQLELVAQDPKRRHNLQSDIRSFFMGFRSSTALSRRGRKKRSEQAVGGSGEEFEFDDVNDSYWTDRIVQNYSAEQLLHERMNGAGNLQLVQFGAEKPAKAGRKSNSRKRFFSGNSPPSAPEFDENAKRIKQESSPAELILNFAERNRIPSEINLNKMFRRFGPLMESETEVDHEAGSAKVIFKRGSDAEVARNSAEKFSIFGPVLVNYQIGYSPVVSVKILPITLSQPHEEATLML